MGRYVPRCKPDGSFDSVQCSGPYCFCSDQDGNRIPGSITLQSVAVDVDKCSEIGKDVIYNNVFCLKMLLGYIIYYCIFQFHQGFFLVDVTTFKVAFRIITHFATTIHDTFASTEITNPAIKFTCASRKTTYPMPAATGRLFCHSSQRWQVSSTLQFVRGVH